MVTIDCEHKMFCDAHKKAPLPLFFSFIQFYSCNDVSTTLYSLLQRKLDFLLREFSLRKLPFEVPTICNVTLLFTALCHKTLATYFDFLQHKGFLSTSI